MPTAVEVLTEWRYYDIAEPAKPAEPGKPATPAKTAEAEVAKLGDIVLVYLIDPAVNPRKNVLKFKDIEGVTDPLLQFKSIPKIDWKKNGPFQSVIFEELVASLDEAWFNFTINNGFIFRKANGDIITAFSDLEVPDESSMPKMNPIVP